VVLAARSSTAPPAAARAGRALAVFEPGAQVRGVGP